MYLSPNRRKLYLENLRGMGEHKILSKGDQIQLRGWLKRFLNIKI